MMSVRAVSRKVIFTCVCVIVSVSLQCSRGEDRASVNDSKVTVLYRGDERIFLHEYWEMPATHLMFLPLVVGDDETGEVQPELAERWEHSEDYREWTFFLRKDVTWHDGVPVTAHDIKFTLDVLRGHPAIWGWGGDASPVEVLDDFTFKVTHNEPTDPLEFFATWHVYYPKHLLEGLDPKEFWTWDFWTKPVGNGPYRYVRHVPKTMVEVEANPDYYRGKPRIGRVILKFSQEPSLVELLSGNVDALTYVGRDMVLTLSGDDRFRSYHRWGYGTMEAIYWNHRNPLFTSPEVRRALTMAINRRALADVLNYPEGVPIMDAITTRRQEQQGLYPEPLPYDPERARQLLEGEGWRDTDGDGVRERDGEEFRFISITDPEREKIAIYVQDQFRRVGIGMEIQVLDHNIILGRIKSGEFDDAGIFLSLNWTNQPSFGHVRMFGEDSPFGYHNPEMIRLLNLAKDPIDPDERDRIYQEIMPIFSADLPITLLLPQVQTYIVHRRIKGLSSPYRADPVWFMEDLWIEEGHR